jgi:hypothetical protein
MVTDPGVDQATEVPEEAVVLVGRVRGPDRLAQQ